MIRIKKFGELTPYELYDILKLRVDVFVVEQKCPYPEMDGLDQICDHIMLYDEEKLSGYARVFRRDAETMQIGRVVTGVRGKGHGAQILKAAVAQCKTYPCEKIFLEAQMYATGFYAKEGFRVVTDPFDEDGIMHVGMIRQL